MKHSTLFSSLPLAKTSHSLALGVDEAGRGAWAGPVVAAAFRWRPMIEEPWKEMIGWIQDSKLLSPLRRGLVARWLTEHHDWSIGAVDASVIDTIGILPATHLAMERAIVRLAGCSGGLERIAVYIDGPHLPKHLGEATMVPWVRGDREERRIAAASILAKEWRDGWMIRAHREDPRYGWDQHKGYGTALHRERLAHYGPSQWHRRSFAPVKVFGCTQPKP
jgi:ribonuclease HII